MWNTKRKVIPIAVGALGTVSQSEREVGEVVITGRIDKKYPDHAITKIKYDTHKSPGDMGRLAVSLPPVKNHKLILI